MAGKNNADFAAKVYAELETVVRDETKNWSWNDWYMSGIDCYLAKETVYLALEWNEPERTGMDFASRFTVGQMARGAWEFPQAMDDFPRFWRAGEKVGALKDFWKWLHEQEGKSDGN